MEDYFELLGPLAWSGAALLFGLVVSAGVLWLVMRAARARAGGGPGGAAWSPEMILKQRYARGEIDRESYTRMLEDLRR